MSVSWELGSDFDWALDGWTTQTATVPPWAGDDSDIFYLESGRQTLAAVSTDLRDRGYRELLMPQHFCESMVEPFVRDGWGVSFYGFDQRWLPQAPLKPLVSPGTTAVLNFPAFGVPESLDWLNFLSETQERGGVVISDESHRVLSPGLAQADIRLASLRKMLPLPDGAFVTGLLGQPTPSAGGQQAAVRAAAMVEKSRYLAGELSHSRHLEMFEQAEDLTHQQTEPALMSELSAERIAALDWTVLRSSRAANAIALETELAGTPYRISTAEAEAPSHVVISGPDVLELRRHLIASRVYCPVHWVRPSDGPLPTSWRDDVLSIPIDHRYAPEDMSRVAEEVRVFAMARRN